MSSRRDYRASRASLFDMDRLEQGGLRSASSYSSRLGDQENEESIDSLHDRVSFLKRLTGDIHEEVDSHNRMLDRMGNEMDSSRGTLSGTFDHFKRVFEKKSNRTVCRLATYIVLGFVLLYFTIRSLLFLYG